MNSSDQSLKRRPHHDLSEFKELENMATKRQKTD